MNKQQERRSPLYFLDQSLQCLLPVHFLLDQMVVLSVCLHLAQLDVLHPNARLMQAQWLMRDTKKWRHCLNMSATADGHWYPQLRRHQVCYFPLLFRDTSEYKEMVFMPASCCCDVYMCVFCCLTDVVVKSITINHYFIDFILLHTKFT